MKSVSDQIPFDERRPCVSIGVPVFNGEEFLAAALDSLLAQTYADFEIIISDNASTDGTKSICEIFVNRDCRVRYYRQNENVGAAPNFNRTFELACGKYFKWHAHDDVCAPTFLERCVAALEAAPESVLCFTRTRFIDAKGAHVSDHDHPLNLETKIRTERFLQFVFPGHIVVEIFGVVRADVLRRTPLIASYIGSDLALLAELGLYGAFMEVPDCLFFHREHPNRSVHAHRDSSARTNWFDTKRSGRYALPTWRLFIEHMLSLVRVPMPMVERVHIVWGLLRRANWHRQKLIGEVLAVVSKKLTGTK